MTTAEFDHPVVVQFPLRGEWTVERTPADRVPSHGTDSFGLRFACDFVRADHRPGFHLSPAGTLRSSLIGVPTRDFYGWGQPVHAALEGEVVDAIDGEPERQWVHMARESWIALSNTLRVARRGLDRVLLAGNHVLIRTDEIYALYAHLASGSVAVANGQRIGVGDLVGRVGHSGNSTAPHLHFHLMDSADPLRAKGIPCAFRQYLVERAGGWERVERQVPRRLERVRSVS